ncbi:hypothetical protein C8Q80DRAFT_1351114 [Daedaleopsis nitida]|nr:hypothetical protein C8Q80DRAFT_1351114 [Daedaleopsis nitida]
MHATTQAGIDPYSSIYMNTGHSACQSGAEHPFQTLTARPVDVPLIAFSTMSSSHNGATVSHCGMRTTNKTLSRTMSELNRHAPLAEIAPYLLIEHSKPWRQARRSTTRDRPGRSSRRNAGRTAWASHRFVCEAATDWAHGERDEEEVEEALLQGDPGTWSTLNDSKPPQVSLLDIARPAKQRGTVQGYELIDSVSKVIALDDDCAGGEDEEEWESIEHLPGLCSVDTVNGVLGHMSYAAALRKDIA